MRGVLFSTGFLALISLVALTGCSSGSVAPTPSLANISGDYSGTMQDAQGGSGTATATLAQTGSIAGGAITVKESTQTVTAQISLAITSSNAVSGSMVIDFANGTTCTYSTSGNYNSTTAVLSGSYTAVTNCAGDSGTYSLTQQCTDTITSARRRDGTGVTAC
ncbi:MAG: hypothetical protein WA629_01745 [Candidatus Aquilonibacter sp.]